MPGQPLAHTLEQAPGPLNSIGIDEWVLLMAVPVGGVVHPEMIVAQLSQVRFRCGLVHIGFMFIGNQGRAREEVLLHQWVEMVFPPILNVIDYD
jgi:hypothetical protein